MIGAMHRSPVLAASALLAFAAVAPSQRVALDARGHGQSERKQLVETLALPDERPAAMDKLWLAGATAIPVLVDAVARDVDDAVPALQLLALLGGGGLPLLPLGFPSPRNDTWRS